MSPEQTFQTATERLPLPVLMQHLPQELLAYPQWVGWRYVCRGANRKPDKQPVNPRTLGNAGVKWPNTWSSVEDAYVAYQAHGLSGIGFVLTADDPFVGVDIDNCLDRATIAPFADDAVAQLASYTEVSPSGSGLRILVVCPEFKDNRRRGQIEVYAHSRFLTLTGQRWGETPATLTTVPASRITTLLPQPQIDAAAKQSSSAPRARPNLEGDDMALWQRIFVHDRYGPQHLQRFQGDLSADGNDHSLAVLRLLNALARWTQGDAARMRSLMLLSPLANEKWFSRRGDTDWLDRQITDAIRFVQR